MTIRHQKFQTAYQLQAQFTDNMNVGTTSYGTLQLSGVSPWVPAVGSWLATLNTVVTKWNAQHSGSVDAAINSDGKLELTAAAGTITSVVATTNGTPGGLFSQWLGYGSGGSEHTLSGGSTISTADNLSDKLVRPASPVLVGRQRNRMANTVGTTSQTGRVVVTSGPQRVNFDSVLINFDDDDYVGIKGAWDDWADGQPFSLFLNRDDEAEYDESTNTDGYITYRLDPQASLREFRPQPLIGGFELLWSYGFTGIHVDASDIVTESDSL